ncbi:MAG: nucleotide sugar dehydrogenase [Pseudomonadota bacterium]
MTAFIDKLAQRQATIGVIGLGYVGLPLLLGLADAGHPCIGFDVDATKTDKLARGESYLAHIDTATIGRLAEDPKQRLTADAATLADADALLICVPTPLGPHNEPDLTYVEATAETIAPHLKHGALVVLESTTYPGTTDEVLTPILEQITGFKAGETLFVAYSPEREDPGNPNYGTTTIPKIVGADDEIASTMAVALYETVVPAVVAVGDARTAEAVKLTENIFRSVNIALVNELKVVFDPMGIDIWTVIEGAKTKPFGYMPFYPGPGLGGHCIPIDPYYLTWKAREYGHHTRFIELAGQINTAMPDYVIAKTSRALNDHAAKALNGARILILGVAYKKNVDDMRESPALVLIEKLQDHGAEVAFYDPMVPAIPPTRRHGGLKGMTSLAWRDDLAADFDAVVVATDHDAIDWAAVARHARIAVDTRNALRAHEDKLGDRLVRA